MTKDLSWCLFGPRSKDSKITLMCTHTHTHTHTHTYIYIYIYIIYILKTAFILKTLTKVHISCCLETKLILDKHYFCFCFFNISINVFVFTLHKTKIGCLYLLCKSPSSLSLWLIAIWCRHTHSMWELLVLELYGTVHNYKAMAAGRVSSCKKYMPL